MALGYVAIPSNECTTSGNEGSQLYNLSEPLPSERLRSLPQDASFNFLPNGTGYSYAYGSRSIHSLFRNYYTLGCALFAALGGLTFGYDQGVIANVLVMKYFRARWPIGPWEIGLMTAVLELGALFGALIAGILADRFSRRHSIFVACVVFCIGSAFQCSAQSLSHLVFGRTVGGLGVGALSMLSPLYMAEISPPEFRGSLVALEQLAIVLGVVLGFWTGFATRSIESSMSWRIPLGVQIFPGLLLCFGCLSLPPSPRLLVLRGQYGDALQSLAKLRLRTAEEALIDPLLQLELLEMRVEATVMQQTIPHDHRSKLRSEALVWAQLFDIRYFDRTLIAVLVMLFQQWSGINALLYYGPFLVRRIGISGENAVLLVAGGIGIVQLIAVIPAIIYIDYWGRKPLLRIGSIIMTVSHLLIAFLIYLYSSNWNGHVSAAWLAVFCVYLFTFSYGFSLGPVAWVLPAEVFPLSMRSRGVALSTASNWLNNFIVGLVTPPLMEVSASATFFTFSTACFLSYLFATYFVPETANVSLEEVDAVFRSAVGMEEQALRRQIEQELGLTDLIERLRLEHVGLHIR